MFYSVIIATPGMSMDNHYVKSLINTVKHLDDNNISWLWVNDYSSHVGQARQRVADQILDYTYNKVIWIDSDIDWTVEEFMRLYESEHDLIGGCYLSTGGHIAAQNLLGFSLTVNDLDGEVQNISSCGFGFLAMRYGILEKLDTPFHSLGNVLNEDVAFCLRAKEQLNVDTMLDTSIRLAHFKTVPLIP